MANTSTPTGTYDRPFVQSYCVGSPHDFGAAADESLSIKGPAGMKGLLREICVSASEIFTTGGAVQVGTAADPDAYAELLLGTLADTDSLNMTEQSGALKDADIPADAQVEVTLVQTGGTPTGQGHVNITIEWY